MELMSSLLLCVLVLLPQTLGDPQTKSNLDVRYNNSLLLKQNHFLHKSILLNVNGPPMINSARGLQSVFMDHSCKQCHDCMERAIKAHETYTYILKQRPSADELHDDILSNEIYYRTRRDIQPTDQTTGGETAAEVISDKKKKMKKIKARKIQYKNSVTVTKYMMDGEVYALKVQEIKPKKDTSNDTIPLDACKIYNVKKSYSCHGIESDSLLAAARKEAYKRIVKKRVQDSVKTTTTTTEKVQLQTSVFKKREVDNSQVVESFMPSVEESY